MTGVLDEEVELPRTDLLTAITIENLGEPHACLGGDPVWYDQDEDRARLERFWSSTTHRGLVDDAGRLRGDYVDLLALLTRSEVECYGWVDGPQGGSAMLAAAIDGDAVLMRRDGDRVRLRPIHADGLVEQVVAVLPDHPPGQGYSITICRAEFDPSARKKQSGEAALLRALLTRPRVRAVQLYAARRDRTGRRQRIERPLTLIDTAESGRWCVFLDTRGPDEPWIVAVPVYPHWLTARLREALRTLR
jgi:hypothetical protein